ncbi:MAG: AMP-binding protein [Anaerolineales bacterium]
MRLNVKDRFPLLTSAGEVLLKQIEEHLYAPKWTHLGVDRLSASAMAGAAAFEAEVRVKPPAWEADSHPEWLPEFASHCYRTVPLYRRRGAQPNSFDAIPTTERSDLAREPWSFVPDDVAVRDITVYHTSGTTGHPLSIITDADTLALYLPLMRAALARYGLTLTGEPGRVAVMVVAHQRRTYTYASVSAVLGQAGVVKVNLNRDEWREADDAARFIDACQPEVIAGNPISLAALAELPLTVLPGALLSTAMTLSAGLRESLQARFGCPVVDVYSMNETGPIAVLSPRTNNDWELLQPWLFVEALNAEGQSCAPGERGEITVTGGFNRYLPLLRYRTNDYARMEFRNDQPVLVDLEGRTPVNFRAVNGDAVNTVDVSRALRPYPLMQYALHQAEDGTLLFRMNDSSVGEHTVRAALRDVFGAEARVQFAPLDLTSGAKVVTYSSERSEGRSAGNWPLEDGQE